MVGHKGDKRLVKRFAEREMERVRAWRGRGRGTEGSVPLVRGRGGQQARGRGRVALGVYRPDGSEDGEEELLEEVQEIGTRTRLNSKRKMPEEEMEEEMPVAKH